MECCVLVKVVCLLLTCGTITSAIDPIFNGKDTINVKTVLFRNSETCRVCWSVDDIFLLVARRMMQDLVPKKLPCDFDKLATYIKTVVDIVRIKSPPEIVNEITMAALDVLGGYLKTVGIPILNEAYYAGNIPYKTAAEIHCLYGRILCSLKTDGSGWAGPIDMRRVPTKVRALNIVIANTSQACNTLELRGNIPQSGPPNPFGREAPKISIPYLDDNSYPNAIAVPLRGNSLFSLMSNSSANLLPKFYILAMRCLSSGCYCKKDILNFNHHLYDWIISSVVPHVHETERWYPGFGGVMRVIETMNQRGLASLDSIRPDTSPANNTITVPGFDEDTSASCSGGKSKLGSIGLILLIVFAGLLLIFFCCCCCYCIFKKCFKAPTPAASKLDVDDEGITKTLVSIYCGVKESIVGSKKDELRSRSQSNCSSKKSEGAAKGNSYSSDECESSLPSSSDRC